MSFAKVIQSLSSTFLGGCLCDAIGGIIKSSLKRELIRRDMNLQTAEEVYLLCLEKFTNRNRTHACVDHSISQWLFLFMREQHIERVSDCKMKPSRILAFGRLGLRDLFSRSEERSVGKEGVSTCRFRWW